MQNSFGYLTSGQGYQGHVFPLVFGETGSMYLTVSSHPLSLWSCALHVRILLACICGDVQASPGSRQISLVSGEQYISAGGTSAGYQIHLHFLSSAERPLRILRGKQSAVSDD